jgi:lipoprotein-releasing system ATP-binding protein
LAQIRNEKIGFVFQFHSLLNEFTALKNVILSGLKLQKYSEQEVEDRAIKRLKTLGMDNHANKKPRSFQAEKNRVYPLRPCTNQRSPYYSRRLTYGQSE